MELFTTAEVVDMAGVGYRRLLQMLEEGWFTPAFTRGRERKTWLFDAGDIWLLRTFMQHRHLFPTSEWKLLVKAIEQARRAGEEGGYIAKVSAGNRKVPSVAPLAEEQIGRVIKDGTLSLLVAFMGQKAQEAV